MPKLSPPERFDFFKPLDWPDWKQNFLRFRLATKLHKEEGAVQVSALIYTMGREAEHVFKSFTLAEGDDAKIYVVLAKFNEHFVLKKEHNSRASTFSPIESKPTRDSRIVRTEPI